MPGVAWCTGPKYQGSKFFLYHFNSHKVLQLRINRIECRKIGFTA